MFLLQQQIYAQLLELISPANQQGVFPQAEQYTDGVFNLAA